VTSGTGQTPATVGRAMPAHAKILIGLVIGAAAGIAAHYGGRVPVIPGEIHPSDLDGSGLHDKLEWITVNIADPVGKIFLRLMFMVVLPLVVSALALAVVEIGDVRRLGKVGLKTLGFTAIFSLTAVMLGIGLVNLIRPGEKLPAERGAALAAQNARTAAGKVADATKAKSLRETLVDIIPENPLQEMVGAVDGSSKGNGMLAVMFFSLMLGAAMTVVPEASQTLVGWLEGLNAISMVIIGWAMRLAPVGAGCLVFKSTASLGFDIVKTLAWFVATVLIGLGLHLCVVYPLVLTFFSHMTPRAFFTGVSEAMLVAFGTSSSSATLPTALKVAEENLKLPKEISRFVLTVGATGNQNGTALYEGVVVLFLAQVFRQDLSVAKQVTVVLMSVLAGIGTAGVPGGSIPLIVVLLQSVGVPAEGIGIILGIDRLLDMCRTVLNVTGDLAIATCVSASAEDSVTAVPESDSSV
jgi:dicarboxylate/amino acid:cation (Na+ or H+) symporter, DAACS family